MTETPNDLEQDLLRLYEQLHTGLLDMVNGNRITLLGSSRAMGKSLEQIWLIDLVRAAGRLRARVKKAADENVQ